MGIVRSEGGGFHKDCQELVSGKGVSPMVLENCLKCARAHCSGVGWVLWDWQGGSCW